MSYSACTILPSLVQESGVRSQESVSPRHPVTLSPQHCIQRLDKEVLAPHDALVDAKPLALVVAAVLQDALPAGCLDRQELGRAERGQDGVGVVAVASGACRL